MNKKANDPWVQLLGSFAARRMGSSSAAHQSILRW